MLRPRPNSLYLWSISPLSSILWTFTSLCPPSPSPTHPCSIVGCSSSTKLSTFSSTSVLYSRINSEAEIRLIWPNHIYSLSTKFCTPILYPQLDVLKWQFKLPEETIGNNEVYSSCPKSAFILGERTYNISNKGKQANKFWSLSIITHIVLTTCPN